MRKMNLIRSHKHQICTKTVNKVALSADDDKREIIYTPLIVGKDEEGYLKRRGEGLF